MVFSVLWHHLLVLVLLPFIFCVPSLVWCLPQRTRMWFPQQSQKAEPMPIQVLILLTHTSRWDSQGKNVPLEEFKTHCGMTKVEAWALQSCSFILHKEELVLCTCLKKSSFNLEQLLDKMHKQSSKKILEPSILPFMWECCKAKIMLFSL